jgi:hypothetical protein
MFLTRLRGYTSRRVCFLYLNGYVNLKNVLSAIQGVKCW